LAYIPQHYYNHDGDRLQALTPRLLLKQRTEFTSHTSENNIYDLTILWKCGGAQFPCASSPWRLNFVQ